MNKSLNTHAISRKQFFWEFWQIQKEIKLILSVKNSQNKKTAREVAHVGIRKLLGFLPRMEKISREEASIALLAFPYAQNSTILPEVLETVDIVFKGIFPEKALVHVEKLQKIQTSRSVHTSFLERLKNAEVDVSRLLNGGQPEEAKALAISGIRELLPELHKMTRRSRQNCVWCLMWLVSWQGIDIVTEVSEGIKKVFSGNIPKNAARKIEEMKGRHIELHVSTPNAENLTSK